MKTRMQAIHEVIVGNEVVRKDDYFFCSPEDAMELDARGAAKAAPLVEARPDHIPEEPKGKK